MRVREKPFCGVFCAVRGASESINEEIFHSNDIFL